MRECLSPSQVFRAEEATESVKTLSFTGLGLGVPTRSG
jgi:hypothetical protein